MNRKKDKKLNDMGSRDLTDIDSFNMDSDEIPSGPWSGWGFP